MLQFDQIGSSTSTTHKHNVAVSNDKNENIFVVSVSTDVPAALNYTLMLNWLVKITYAHQYSKKTNNIMLIASRVQHDGIYWFKIIYF